MYKIPANTLFIGQKLVFVPECHSTNTLALEISQKGFTPEGMVVITDNQVMGRGQRGNQWESNPGQNLTFSILLKPNFLEAKAQFYLNIVVSVAISDYLMEKFHSAVKIKWPNDIYLDDIKVCGILIENSIVSTSSIGQSIVGIGLNINQTQFSVSATSLSWYTGLSYDLERELHALLEKIEHRYMQLRSDSQKSLKEEYLQRLYRMGENHQFLSDGRVFTGIIKGISEYGKLVIRSESRDREFDLKEVSFA